MSVFFLDFVFLHVFMQISPVSVRGTYGSLLQIASCVGILAALVAGLPAHSVPGWYVVEIPFCWRDVCATFAYIHYFLFFHCAVVKIVILGIGKWVLLVSTACFHIIGMQKNSGGFWNCAVELRLANFVSRWRACFWISTVPACLLALGMEFCAESPRWLFKVIAACLMVVLYAYDVYVLLSWSKYGIQGRELLLIEVLSQMLWPAIRMV